MRENREKKEKNKKFEYERNDDDFLPPFFRCWLIMVVGWHKLSNVKEAGKEVELTEAQKILFSFHFRKNRSSFAILFFQLE